MRLFLSTGEPSGDLHGAALVRELRRRVPDLQVAGFGGPKLAAEGARLLYPLAEHPVIGLLAAFKAVPFMLRRVAEARDCFRRHRPDLVVVVDSPGFHWHLAKAAHDFGLPVAFHIAPQLWAWGGWRVGNLKRFAAEVFCTLPFEQEWLRRRGVRSDYIGHPFFDEPDHREHDAALTADLRRRGRVVALLPGSRTYEVTHNARLLAEVAIRLHRRHEGLTFAVAGFKPGQRAALEAAFDEAAAAGADVKVAIGRTPEIMAAAEVAVSVSGSVSLELMQARVPTAIVYKISPFFNYVLKPALLKTPYVTLVNLMAGRELFPEFVGDRLPAERVAAPVSAWLADPVAAEAVRTVLGDLTAKYARPGASARAAELLAERYARPARPSMIDLSRAA